MDDKIFFPFCRFCVLFFQWSLKTYNHWLKQNSRRGGGHTIQNLPRPRAEGLHQDNRPLVCIFEVPQLPQPVYPPGRPRSARTSHVIKKIEKIVAKKGRQSTRKISKTVNISQSSVHNTLTEDSKSHPNKCRKEPKITQTHQAKRKQFANWGKKHFSKIAAQRAVFCDEKFFNVDGVNNHQNHRIWASSRIEADKKGPVLKKQKFPQKVMIWLAVAKKNHSRPIIFKTKSVDHSVYISKALPEALWFGTSLFGPRWTFVQDGATPHTHHLTQQWCSAHLPSFIPASLWPPNSPDLNPLDFSIWNEMVEGMHWQNVVNKQSLIKEVRRSCQRLNPDTLQKSCQSWRKRVLTLLDNDGAYVQWATLVRFCLFFF